MRPTRTQTIITVAWVLFWLLMTTTAVQEYWRENDHGVWKPILWETSSAFTATLLILAQRHFTRRYDHLISSPLR
ncbi:MAG TPA: hypothetical protein VF670_06390 [Duganella sp.]|jgi:hypothetical protein